MVTRRKTGTYAVGRARRERILDIAMENFAQLGYYRTSMSKIAQDVGLTGPGLTHHFPTKQHLLVAIADRRFDITNHWAEEALRADDGTGPLRGLLQLTKLLLSQPGLIELFVIVSAEAGDPTSPAHDLYVRRYAVVVEHLTAAFQRSADDGRLSPGLDYEAIARECIAVSDGFQLQWVLSGGSLDLVTRVREYLERLAPTILVSGERVDLSE